MSVAFTVRAMDAGPILAQEHVAVDDAVQAPELLDDLFRRGTELLIRNLPLVWDGHAQQQASPQVSFLAVTNLCTSHISGQSSLTTRLQVSTVLTKC